VTLLLPSAQAVLADVRARTARIRAHPGSVYRWLPNQESFRSSSAKVRMIRQGNQWGGKSTVALEEMLCFLLGYHPEKAVPPAPVEWWIMCAESSQSVAIQRKLWDLCPKDAVDPSCEFDEVRGFRGRQPVLRLTNGSICRIKTTGQRTISLSGATIDGVLFDEPPPSPRLYTEISKRVMNRSGVILLSMTPVNVGPLGWLSQLVEDGQIEDHHARLTPEALIPDGATDPITLPDGTPCDARWVAQLLAMTPPYEREIVCHGEWENRVVDRVFTAFNDSMITEDLPPGAADIRLGLDYGDKIGKQYGTLIAVIPGLADQVWILDETPQTEHSTIEADAAAVLEMLARHGLVWTDLAEATGDRQYERGMTYKGNRELHRAISRILDRPAVGLYPRIRTAKRMRDTGRFSVDAGVRYMHRAMVAGRYHVHPRCGRHIDALRQWDGRQHQSRHTNIGLFTDSFFKDPIDAVRYGLESRIFAPSRERSGVVRFG